MAARFRRAAAAEPGVVQAGIDPDSIEDHHGVASAIGRICRVGGIVALDGRRVPRRREGLPQDHGPQGSLGPQGAPGRDRPATRG